ncbi:DNA damage-binding protein 2 isoform X1 [Typha latifolia]|uniref:DNA damage-binding protein 2 isoform X1 n=2 Tax=Typha latifolia TaxID=4733 RepID=UPI003C2DA1C2
MPPPKRRRRFVHNTKEADSDEESSSSSSSSSSDEEEDDQIESQVDDDGEEEEVEEDKNAKEKKMKVPITISLKKVCKVCKGKGHEAGFKGAVYIDCPMKPCFLCKKPGHTTMTCPHRVAMEHGVVPAPTMNTKTSFGYIFKRQVQARIPMIKLASVVPTQLECGNIRFHSRRVTCLEFHPTRNNVVLSGDKKGQVGIWDYCKLQEKMIYGSIHTCIVNNMKFNLRNDEVLYTSSSDGTISCTDLETGISSCLLDLNPDGWNGPATWRMFYGMDINVGNSLLLVADNFGYLYLLDERSRTKTGEPIRIHNKGSKVVGLHCNPVQPDLLLSCGNDHFARIWDARRLEAGSSLASLAHGRVVNSAYFSPITGSKILTTSQDNRIRLWDSIFGNLDSPSREIVHSHDFNRHLTPFRAEWDPKDHSESVAVIGRYISENYNGVALHPIDFIDTSTGKLLAEVFDPDISTISPVNKLHPRDDVLASGSSRSLFIWKPKEEIAETTQEHKRNCKEFIYPNARKKSRGKLEDDSDDDSDFGSKGKKDKAKKKYSIQTLRGKGKAK